MSFVACHRAKHPYVLLVVSFVLAAIVQGCGGSNLDRVAEEQVRDYNKIKLAKFDGQVTVDGQPPEKSAKLFVILSDPSNLDEAKKSKAKTPRQFAVCDADGRFAFKPKPGKYVVSFVELHAATGAITPGAARKMGGGGFGAGGLMTQQFRGPDGLKNLYNDPEKNSQQKEFNVDIVYPGKDDYRFNLAVADKEALQDPGPQAWTVVTAPFPGR